MHARPRAYRARRTPVTKTTLTTAKNNLKASKLQVKPYDFKRSPLFAHVLSERERNHKGHIVHRKSQSY